MKVSVAEAKNKLTQLLQAVENGENVTICRHGKPVADLIRTKQPVGTPRRLGTLKQRIRFLDPAWDRPIDTDSQLEAFLRGEGG